MGLTAQPSLGFAPERGHLGESSLAAYCGMHATPDYYGKSEPPDRLPACIGTL